MLKDVIEASGKKKRKGKESLYVHVMLNHAWLLGYMHGTEKTMANIKRPIQDIFKRRVKGVGSPCVIRLVISTWDNSPGKVYVYSKGAFSDPAPKGSKSREVERVARDVVAYVLDMKRDG